MMIKDLWSDRGYLRQLDDDELIDRGLASNTDLALVLAERLAVALAYIDEAEEPKQ